MKAFPIWPKSGSLGDKALTMFVKGMMIDHPQFAELTGSWRLAAVVCDLKKLGWPIQSIHTPCPTDDQPSRVITRYRLPSAFVKEFQAGEFQ